jgi:hypothetical protein
MEYMFELVTPDIKHLEDSAKPLNELGTGGWEVVAFVPMKDRASYLALLKRDKELGLG